MPCTRKKKHFLHYTTEGRAGPSMHIYRQDSKLTLLFISNEITPGTSIAGRGKKPVSTCGGRILTWLPWSLTADFTFYG